MEFIQITAKLFFKTSAQTLVFLTRSTIAARDTIKWTDGKEYPLVKIEVSSKSHPFYTGKQMILDTAGRVDKFRKKIRYVICLKVAKSY